MYILIYYRLINNEAIAWFGGKDVCIKTQIKYQI